MVDIILRLREQANGPVRRTSPPNASNLRVNCIVLVLVYDDQFHPAVLGPELDSPEP